MNLIRSADMGMRSPLLFTAIRLAACAPQSSTGYTTVSVQELKTAYASGAFVLDVRTPAEYAEGQ